MLFRSNLTNQQLQYLQDGLKTVVKDWRTAADEINNGLKAAARSASSGNSNSGGGSTPLQLGGVFSMLGDLYDRYKNEAFRMGTDDIANLMKDVTNAIAAGSFTGVKDTLIKVFKENLSSMMAEMQEIDDKIIKVVNENSMFAGSVADNMREEMRDVLPLAQKMGVSVNDMLSGAENL